MVGVMWSMISPLLMQGLGASDGQLSEAVDDILNGRAHVWIVITNEQIKGVFLTAMVVDDYCESIDVYALAGEGIIEWGKAISERMAKYAKANGCKRVLFAGRKALLKVYEGARIVGELSPGVYQFERAVA